MSATGRLDALSAPALEAVAALWRRERRVLRTSFGGTSMLPAIAPGQPVTVECGVEPAVGDVAVFRFEDQVGVHRVVARGVDWLLTWGDANPLPDEPIEPARVIGTVRAAPPTYRLGRRRLLLRFLLPSTLPRSRAVVRVRLLYRIRTRWAEGPRAFLGACARTLLARRTASRDQT